MAKYLTSEVEGLREQRGKQRQFIADLEVLLSGAGSECPFHLRLTSD